MLLDKIVSRCHDPGSHFLNEVHMWIGKESSHQKSRQVEFQQCKYKVKGVGGQTDRHPCHIVGMSSIL